MAQLHGDTMLFKVREQILKPCSGQQENSVLGVFCEPLTMLFRRYFSAQHHRNPRLWKFLKCCLNDFIDLEHQRLVASQ